LIDFGRCLNTLAENKNLLEMHWKLEKFDSILIQAESKGKYFEHLTNFSIDGGTPITNSNAIWSYLNPQKLVNFSLSSKEKITYENFMRKMKHLNRFVKLTRFNLRFEVEDPQENMITIMFETLQNLRRLYQFTVVLANLKIVDKNLLQFIRKQFTLMPTLYKAAITTWSHYITTENKYTKIYLNIV